MEDHFITFMKSLVYAKTSSYLEIIEPKKLTKRNRTCLTYNPVLGVSYIRLNMLELESISLRLIYDRGFSYEWFTLEVVLHEICHFKQNKKFMRRHRFLGPILTHFRDKQHMEDVADRYAIYCRKIITRDIKQWITLNDILSGK